VILRCDHSKNLDAAPTQNHVLGLFLQEGGEDLQATERQQKGDKNKKKAKIFFFLSFLCDHSLTQHCAPDKDSP